MRNFQLLGVLLIIAGSFLPLVHIPVIGNWNYWKIEPVLAAICWLLSIAALAGILSGKQLLVKTSAFLLILLFAFTIYAVKQESMDFFSFLPFTKLQNLAASVVKIQYGWLLEFGGALLILLARINNKSE